MIKRSFDKGNRNMEEEKNQTKLSKKVGERRRRKRRRNKEKRGKEMRQRVKLYDIQKERKKEK